MPARNRARQIEKRPHRNDAAFSISEREGANLRNSNPTLWDWQERTRRSNLRQTPPRFVITIKMPSGTGPSSPRLFRAHRFRAEDRMTKPTDIDRNVACASRRRFLREGSVLLGGAVIARGLAGSKARAAAENAGNLPPDVPEWMKTPGDPMGTQPYGAPSPFEKDVIKNISKTLPQYLSASGRTPLQDLDGIITPNGLFYERHHGGVPTIDPAQHRLMLHGLVDRPLIFTMDDLRRFPSESRIHFLECSGNPTYKKPYGKTASDLVGLVSCAEWTGVSLKLVLLEAGLQPGAKWVVAEGADAAALTRSVPIEKCLEDAMLVYSQNGERLRPQQGYPLRLLLPGFEGNM